ncbi:hypothetical protein STEG23_038152 [Scotinomys teguina]
MRGQGRKESLSESRDLDGSYDQLTEIQKTFGEKAGRYCLSAGDLRGGAWAKRSQPSHEPLPPQVPEPIGTGSSVPLPVGDWVAVARNCLTTFLQKMDRNKDGVVTIGEFIESCQKPKDHLLSLKQQQQTTRNQGCQGVHLTATERRDGGNGTIALLTKV